MTDSTTDLIGATEAAVLAKANERTVKRAAKSGRLPHVLKMPGKTGAYLFDREAVLRWAENRNKADEDEAGAA